jgi:hypothetical protein
MKDVDEPVPDLVSLPEEPINTSKTDVNLKELNRLLKDSSSEVNNQSIKGNKVETNETETESETDTL